MRLPSRNAICDAVVQQAIAQGEFRRAAEELTRGYQDAVVRCCTDYFGSAAEGQEVAQEIFLGAYTAMARFRRHASVYTWLCAIFKRQCYQALRDLMSKTRIVAEHAPAIADELHPALQPPEEDELRKLIQRVMEALSTLSKEEQLLLRMRYAAMAGYNTDAIVTKDDRVNFFAEWVRALDPSRVVPTDPSHPTPQQRVETVRTSLRQILAKVDLFNGGLWFYQAGDYQTAAAAFDEFRSFFPSREVYHNLAASHHQVAAMYANSAGLTMPFKLSLTIDPVTWASFFFQAAHRPEEKTPAELFREHLDQAIDFYQQAKALDPSYVPAYNNLGCALLMNGEAHKAIEASKEILRAAWGPPDERPVLVGTEHFDLATYQNGVQILFRKNLIWMMQTPEEYQGRSARGISLGSTETDLRATYGLPSRILHMTQGASWVYEVPGMIFHLREGTVISWQVGVVKLSF